MTGTGKGKAALLLVLAVTGIGSLVIASLATAGHVRPKGATPMRVSLVPAYAACAAPNRTHGPPLAFPSCNPPARASGYLTVGTPDANGALANSQGFMKFIATYGSAGPPDDDSNVLVRFEITDVRCAAGATPCGNANATDGPDYTGEVESNITLRLSDHNNATTPGGGTNPATMTDVPIAMTATCSNTADTSIGATCSVIAFQPMLPAIGGSTYDQKRTVIEFGQVTVNDGGADGVVTSQDNTVFMRQGIFIP